MRRIILRHVMVDKDDWPWEFQLTVPWVDKPSDSVQYGRTAADGVGPVLLHINTPNDPEHEMYGMDGMTFTLAQLKRFLGNAEEELAVELKSRKLKPVGGRS